jgi:threonine 3-dehydrogenase
MALNSLLKNLIPGGKVALLGILKPGTKIDWDQVIFKMLNIQGIFGRRIFETWYQMVQLIESGLDLTPLITHEFSLKDHEEAFSIMQRGDCGKIIFHVS